ncbi:chitobiase/beta-hexosaminidase C-terminal domain-containing protein [Ruminococcus sp. OA3]|uniref:chitobiase/beta-hexosaminidase C-terminal domain-containing protein n=1 Tax=Ruminococcus sp. OA3 TaxID=2914164 RepID=UPI001F06E281|nr:chitobiase/beta-hexosaminidase C-terminal domain-containing protein [Ruminococcus sp. OA3]MCH1983683.1 chitobiase/beta-hexosaminidase C-terminal domain-containing protein [Ruminococcus sp. OA3]
MKKMMKKVMSYMLITAVMMTNLALVPVAASQEDATGKSDEVQETSTENAGAADVDKAEKKNVEDNSNTAPGAKNGTVEKPTATPESATYKGEQTIKLECNTQGAEIYYTTDGAEPSNDPANTSAKKYDAEFKVTANTAVNPAVAATTTVKAIAYVGEDKSDTETFQYTIDPNFTIAKPTASVASGTYKAAQTVTLTCDTPDVDIYYTTDGRDPDREGKVGEKYDPAKPITIDKNMTLKVKAFEGDVKSELAAYEYKIDPNFTVAAPTADPAAGTYQESQAVKLSCATPNAEIYYTTDGKTPDKTQNIGTKYDGSGITVATSMTVKAIAYAGDASSEVAEYRYEINVPVTTENIETVTVNKLTAAKRGEKPDTDAESAEPAKYTVEKVEWKDDEGKAAGGRFEADSTYYAYITLTAVKGYEFDGSIFVQNKTCAAVKVDGYSGTPVVTSYGKDTITVATGYKTSNVETASADSNKITGIKSSYTKNATVTFSAIGAGSTNEEVHGNERYVPVEYQVGSKSVEITDNKASVTKSYKVASAGTYKMQVTFQKQVYDADAEEWKDVADDTDVKEVSFKVTSTGSTRKSGTTTRKPTAKTTSTRAKNARTADETPLGAMAAVCVLAGTAAVVMTVRRRKNG